MSDWFTSKLKAAESILQKIDQQAAESLGKNEDARSDDLSVHTPAKLGGIVPLKDQLKKKAQDNNEYGGRLSTDSKNGRSSSSRSSKEIASTSASPGRTSAVTDGDWTELLGSPSQPTPLPPASRSHSTFGVPMAKSNSRRQGIAGSNILVPELKRNQRTDDKATKSGGKTHTLRNAKVNGKQSDGEDSSFMDSAGVSSKFSLQDHENLMEHQEHNQKDPWGIESINEDPVENAVQMDLEHQHLEDVTLSMTHDGSKEITLASGIVDTLPELKLGLDKDSNGLESNRQRDERTTLVNRENNSRDIDVVPSGSDGLSDSETESGSTSDSDSEREHQREERKRRREKILAQKAAAKAVEAIRERENMVARLEGEKQSLEKIIEERARQQDKEASELQNIMIETMEAVEQEKQKHNNTRMEAFARLAKLETANADLAKSLAAAQWNLEIEVKRVAELRQQVESKEVAHEELKRRISSSNGRGMSVKQLAVLRGVEVERELLEAEYAVLSDKIQQLQEKAKSLEKNIEMTRKEMEEPTEVEVELQRRLAQLTDHLIQKQAQVEALSSEKATLHFRIEAVSSSLEETKSTMNMNDFSSISLKDVESGIWEPSNMKSRPSLEEKIRSGKEQLGSLLKQLDAIFLAGAVFLRRNPTAKIWAGVYLVCLHFWVVYILTSHSQPSNDIGSGAVISLANINSSSTI